ncbi:TlyA family RNA methyltransferase [Catenisphaera adipataccumulans]|uniref:23S rRNA (Cytidine1920-2'-O)/16S rRNA (Cytidine1409-2'-O)-methyltransferase n=1 Tax=Catenisphaera adipataccumulans TaxID=700500 RepID=A0A7W8FY68_9FIRM|nr:TlyA family RNA methyltransferase [Catenisphaera adipataccumulans]MBB5183697.1 23S rRNA (cytidine1920-2'-O)/16S rRNA (cytidine1409-2'-O)-methyltransferase [Catenisphaera adipataccumulans]
MYKERLDIVCSRQLASRAKAQDAIQEGRVKVNGCTIKKNSFAVSEEDTIEIQPREKEFVSRGGYKLKIIFDRFSVSVDDQIVLDIGASTGGFTDVCLRHGARKVYALDVGHLQLDARLDQDPAVVKMEGRNARDIQPDWFEEPIDFICMDVSFISCRTILSHLFQVLPVPHLAVLIKPQVECGPAALNKHGVLKDKKLQMKIVNEIKREVLTKYRIVEVIPSPIEGRGGNQEFVLYAEDLR